MNSVNKTRCFTAIVKETLRLPRLTPSPDGRGGTSALSLNKPFLFQVSGRHLFGVLAFHGDLRVELLQRRPVQ